MSISLKEYVEKFLTNKTSINIDDDGNAETQAQVIDTLEEGDDFEKIPITISKLRAHQATQFDDEEKYLKRKVSRNKVSQREREIHEDTLEEVSESDNDEGELDNGEDEIDNSEDENVHGKDVINSVEDDTDSDNSKEKTNHCKNGIGIDNFVDTDDSEDDENVHGKDEINSVKDDTDNSKEKMNHCKNGIGIDNIVDTDDSEGDSISVSLQPKRKRAKIDESEDQLRMDNSKTIAGKLIKNNSDQQFRSNSVRNQMAIYHNIFELRILRQKINNLSNQLPQYDTFQSFLEQNNVAYISALRSCRKASQHNIKELLELQTQLVKQYDGTRDLALAKVSPKNLNNTLEERHEAFKPFVEETLTFWHGKITSIYLKSFKSFATSIVQQYKNALSNREALINRTRSIADVGMNNRVMGSRQQQEGSLLQKKVDPEVFDDSNFYARLLEEVVKTKPSSTTADCSRDLQEAKKSSKSRKHDKMRSKNRDISYAVRSKAQQFIHPMKVNVGGNSTSDILHKSIFGAYKN